jgi:16S rRNA (cytidine1402-2'-O)-methyltransferase
MLYVIATPIGNLGDISARAIQVLRQVDLIAAEDTRLSKHLLSHLGITTPLRSMHEHNEDAILAGMVDLLSVGQSIAVIADAGTPLISDPGFPLVRECRRRGIRVSPVPGPCAAIAALSASGLATNRFRFEGFPPRTASSRRQFFRDLATEQATLIFYESSHRILSSLNDMAAIFGSQRLAVLARELTKLHETFLAVELGELVAMVGRDSNQQKGEIVVLVAGAEEHADEISAEAVRLLQILRDSVPLKQAVALAAQISGEKRNRLYEYALKKWQQ